MSEERKQWTIQEISSLIDAYREHRNLWDPRNPNYKNRVKKIDAYKEIASRFGTNCSEIDRKIKNIISQYQRERRNYKRMKKSGAGRYFKAKWFGYDAMSFLQYKNEPWKDLIGGKYEEIEYSDEEPQTGPSQDTLDITSRIEGEVGERPLGTNIASATLKETHLVPSENISKLQRKLHTQQHPNRNTPESKIRKNSTNISHEANESTQVLQMMKSIFNERAHDECDVFGEMVAHNIRNIRSEYSKLKLQQQITNLLYEARILQIPQDNSAQSFVPLPSPSSLSP